MKSELPISDGQKNADIDTFKVILGTIGDTTWRMFVPAVGLTLFGVWLDTVFDTKPWLMAGGIVLGFVTAAILVKSQVGKIRVKKESIK